jgi:predicted NUDIX family NTP pyrophosphohydrolase
MFVFNYSIFMPKAIYSMSRKSAGIVLFRRRSEGIEFFLVHPGGPFWKNKDAGAWSVPKGEFNDNEYPLAAAIREFEEETGTIIEGDFIQLSPVKLKSGKTIYAWALENDIDPVSFRSNLFEMEWPPHSGKKQEFPEIDKAEWFSLEQVFNKINTSQVALIEELISMLFPRNESNILPD